VSGANSSLLRDKPRRILWALGYRIYLVLRRFLPSGWLLDRLLDTAWAANRLAWEQTWEALPRAEAHKLLRANTERVLSEAIDTGDRVVDIGGGDGTTSYYVARHAASVLYIDQDPGNVDLARARLADVTNVELVQGEAVTELNRRDGFDVAVMLHLLEHLDEPVEALRSLRAKCRRVVIEVPDFNAQPLNRVRAERGLPFYSDDDHITEFTAESLEQSLTEAGWAVSALRAEGGMLFAIAN